MQKSAAGNPHRFAQNIQSNELFGSPAAPSREPEWKRPVPEGDEWFDVVSAQFYEIQIVGKRVRQTPSASMLNLSPTENRYELTFQIQRQYRHYCLQMSFVAVLK